MNNVQITIDPSVLNQRQTINLPYMNTTKRVQFETAYDAETDMWYISIYDAQSGNPYCTNVPVIASYGILMNLLEPFTHKRIGWLLCYPYTDSPSTPNPSKDNWDEFGLVWGDVFA